MNKKSKPAGLMWANSKTVFFLFIQKLHNSLNNVEEDKFLIIFWRQVTMDFFNAK